MNSFTYKGKSSDEMFLKIAKGLVFTSPERDIDFVIVQGRDGAVPIDNGRYKTVVRSVPCHLEIPEGFDIEELLTDMNDWLSTDVNFHEFFWSRDPDFTYRAMVHKEMDVVRTLSQYGRAILKFRFHPIKYYTPSLVERQISQGMTINNPFGIDAKPIIRIVGNGNITVSINGRILDLRNVDHGITVDSGTQTVTGFTGQFTEFDKMFSYPFPVLKPGNNQISWTGDIQQVFITPRIGALIT